MSAHPAELALAPRVVARARAALRAQSSADARTLAHTLAHTLSLASPSNAPASTFALDIQRPRSLHLAPPSARTPEHPSDARTSHDPETPRP